MLPSEVRMKVNSGYRRQIPVGWRPIPGAEIIGDGYTVKFYRLSERTIDEMCDALNGWRNVWTKFYCEYSDRIGTLAITVRKPEDADKLYKLMDGIKPVTFEHEGTSTAVEMARITMEAVIELIKRQK